MIDTPRAPDHSRARPLTRTVTGGRTVSTLSILRVVAIALLGIASARSPALADEAKDCCGRAAHAWRPAEIEPHDDGLLVLWPGDRSAVPPRAASTDTLQYGSDELRETAAHMRRTRALVEVGKGEAADTVTALGVRATRGVRIGFMSGIAAALLLVVALLTGGRLRQLALGQDGRYSKSKCQALAWFSVLIVSYLSTLAMRWWAGGAIQAGGVGVPQNLLLLSGLSALTFVSAKAITQSKLERAEVRARERGESAPQLKSAPRRARFPGDLVNDDFDTIDLGDLQMIVVTLIAVILYGMRVFVCLGRIELGCAASLPDVDTALLGGFAIGQGAYLAKKAASRPGEG